MGAGKLQTPTPAAFVDSLRRGLVVLALQPPSDKAWLTVSQVSRALLDEYGLDVHWRTLRADFDNNRSLVTRRKRNGQWQYRILKAGQDAVLNRADDAGVQLVDPAQAVSATVSLHDALKNLGGKLSLCDPYLSSVTVNHLDALAPKVQIRFLTENIHDRDGLRALLKAFVSTGRSLEVRTPTATKLHDRYVLGERGGLILGGSLNGFGKRQTMVVKLGQDHRKILSSAFEQLWKTAKEWKF